MRDSTTNGWDGTTDMILDIAVFEDDRVFANYMEQIIRSATNHPTAINTDSQNAIYHYLLKSTRPTLYFLDIIIENQPSGFELAERIYENAADSKIVFITKYPEAILGNAPYKVMAYSTILKCNPLLEQEIKDTIHLAQEEVLGNSLYVVHNRYEDLYIPINTICFIEHIISTNKICIHCIDGRYILWDSLKNISKRLPGRFVRCHNSFLVNRDNIRCIDKKTRIITFVDGSQCPYSMMKKGGLFL